MHTFLNGIFSFTRFFINPYMYTRQDTSTIVILQCFVVSTFFALNPNPHRLCICSPETFSYSVKIQFIFMCYDDMVLYEML